MNARKTDARTLRPGDSSASSAEGGASPSVGNVLDHDDLRARIDRLYDRYVVGPKGAWQARPGDSGVEGGAEGVCEGGGDSGSNGGISENGQTRPMGEGQRLPVRAVGSQGGMPEGFRGSGSLQESQRNEGEGRRDDEQEDGGNGVHPRARAETDGGDAFEDEWTGVSAATISYLEDVCPAAARSARIRSGTIRRMTEATKTLKGLLPLLDKIETAR